MSRFAIRLVAAVLALTGLAAPAFAQTYDNTTGYARRVPAGTVITDQNGNPMQVPFTASIGSGQTTSGAVDLGSTKLFALQMPATWTTASITFLVGTVQSVSRDCSSASYMSLYDDTGTEVSVTATANQFIVLSNPTKFIGVRCLQIRSGTSATPVAQGQVSAVQLVGVP